jgi:hypothetical protein
MLKMVEYKDAQGKTQDAGYMTRGSAYQLTGKRERFAQLMAQGYEDIEAYCEAFGEILTPDVEPVLSRKANRLCHDTAIVLRIADLRKPVLRKLAGKIEYTIEQALTQCQAAYDLAFVQGDPKAMLKASEMLSRLSKLLSEEINVNHRHGLLDDASTEVLLAMRKEIEIRQTKAKRLGPIIEGEIVVPPTPHQAALGPLSRVPSEAVPKTVGPEKISEKT